MRTRKGIPTDQDLEALNETLPVLPAKASGLCVICLDEVSSGESVRELTCQHIFHAECLDTWWQRSARSRSTSIREISCPTCRQRHSLERPNSGNGEVILEVTV
ncbi:E3 ubiquitin-protein ligase hrd-1 (RING-type E3 ubiquitin transferase hrd-1) (Suppressor/enhancer of lin-12) [Durusdinium trenchii]|uniref:E3 ubiquitin-protein ligase hrd-1 (RING-type E3 ubiquitin transferase hrd-1) (Suppressor/enhancer of lin-12) n=1 Tax=Durusdinium trenchii TaxID=1381693 RepID=A0ABP0KHS7_9DINO